jgi:hypothetical protein
MNNKNRKESPTTLTDQRFAECVAVARGILKTKPSIRNRDLRQFAGVGYDQAIHFFNRAISENLLVRQGSGSGTCYILLRRAATPNEKK